MYLAKGHTLLVLVNKSFQTFNPKYQSKNTSPEISIFQLRTMCSVAFLWIRYFGVELKSFALFRWQMTSAQASPKCFLFIFFLQESMEHEKEENRKISKQKGKSVVYGEKIKVGDEGKGS